MSQYILDFKYRAVFHYHQVHGRQRTAECLKVSRTYLSRWVAAYRKAALPHFNTFRQNS